MAGSTWTLLLLRHAKSSWDEPLPDHDRPLAARGRRDALAAGALLTDRGWKPNLVLCSTATRTRQTWERAVQGGAVADAVDFTPRIYDAAATELLSLVREVPDGVATAMLIGHAPGIPGLANMLGRRPDPASAWSRMDTKFPTSGLAVLRSAVPWSQLGDAELVAFEVPRG